MGAPRRGAQVEEKLEFKVIEFNKDAKRIIVSHSRIHEDAQGGGSDESRKGKRSGKKDNQSSTVAIPVMEKTTLGDIEELAALKEKLDNQKAAAFKKEAKAKAKEEKSKAAEAEVKNEPKTATETEEAVENKTEEATGEA